MSKHTITLTLNGQEHTGEADSRMLLAHFIRDVLRLTGTHVGCDTGNCGACKVLLDGKAVKSGMLLAVQADGSEVRTLEGVAPDGELHPVQRAFWEKHGMQCGFCTPGVVMTVLELLEHHPEPTREQATEWLGGNICRCTGHVENLEAGDEGMVGMKRRVHVGPKPSAPARATCRAAGAAAHLTSCGAALDNGARRGRQAEQLGDQHPALSRAPVLRLEAGKDDVELLPTGIFGDDGGHFERIETVVGVVLDVETAVAAHCQRLLDRLLRLTWREPDLGRSLRADRVKQLPLVVAFLPVLAPQDEVERLDVHVAVGDEHGRWFVVSG